MTWIAYLTSGVVMLGLAVSGSPALPIPAQTDEVVSLKQITLRLSPDQSKAEHRLRIEAFRVAKRAINSCVEVDAVARKLGDAVFYQPASTLRNLPPPVRLLLASAGPERATVAFRQGLRRACAGPVWGIAQVSSRDRSTA